jgi:hypothetical protein
MKAIKFTVGCAVALLATLVAPAYAQHHDHGHAHGEKKDLGTTTIAGLKLTVSQMGTITPGGEGVFEVSLGKGQPKPKAIRLWVGVPSGEGSVKAKATSENQDYDVHVEVPKTLPENSRLWVEVEPATGKKFKLGLGLRK